MAIHLSLWRRHSRTTLASLVGFTTVVLVALALGAAGDAIDVPPIVFFDPPLTREIDGDYQEISSATTSFGLAAGIFATVVGIWAGRATYSGGILTGLTPVARFTFLAWLMAATLLVFAGALLDLAFRHQYGWPASYVHGFLDISIAGGIAWSCRQWWKNRIAAIDRQR